MRIAAALLLCTLAGGCNAPVAQPTVHAKEEARAKELEKVKGWDKVFGAPDATIGSANQFGFRATPYAAAGKAYASKGGPVMVAGSMAKVPNRATFAAEGTDAKHIDTVRFELSIGDAKTAHDARDRFARIVRDFLFLSDLDAEPLMPAMTQGVAARGDLAGTPYSIEPSNDRLTVTFNRTKSQGK